MQLLNRVDFEAITRSLAQATATSAEKHGGDSIPPASFPHPCIGSDGSPVYHTEKNDVKLRTFGKKTVSA